MIIIVERHNADQHADLLDQMFRLRARVFSDRLGWDVDVEGGQERDRYDGLHPLYLLDVSVSGDVLGSLRLLPTTGPTVVADFFQDTLPDAAFLSAPAIWECTRFCLDDRLVGADHRSQIVASARLIGALGEIALRSGIESILGNFDGTMIRLYRRIGCEVDILGVTHRFGRPVYLGLFPVNRTILARVKTRMDPHMQDGFLTSNAA